MAFRCRNYINIISFKIIYILIIVSHQIVISSAFIIVLMFLSFKNFNSFIKDYLKKVSSLKYYRIHINKKKYENLNTLF